MKPLPLSVIVLTYNEELNIAACLKSVVDWAGEVFVVDSGSTDTTTDIARRYTRTIVHHPFENYAHQRNWAQSNLPLQYMWVMHIDADEVVSNDLADELRAFFNSGQPTSCNGAMIPRRTIFMNRWIRHGGQYPVFHLRLYRRDRGRCEERSYDQHFLAPPPLRKMHSDIVATFTENLHDWTLKHLRWASAEAQEYMRSEAADTDQVTASLFGNAIERRRWLRKVVFARSPLFFRAFGYFLYRYIAQMGFLDGREGLIFHFLHACWFRFYTDAIVFESRRQNVLEADARSV